MSHLNSIALSIMNKKNIFLTTSIHVNVKNVNMFKKQIEISASEDFQIEGWLAINDKEVNGSSTPHRFLAVLVHRSSTGISECT